MIKISAVNTSVEVIIDGPQPALHDIVFRFSWNAGTEWSARLLAWSLRELMFEKLQAIRAEAYAQGWRDAKAKKRAKSTWFPGVWG